MSSNHNKAARASGVSDTASDSGNRAYMGWVTVNAPRMSPSENPRARSCGWRPSLLPRPSHHPTDDSTARARLTCADVDGTENHGFVPIDAVDLLE